jgi:hypothetical protein
MTALNNQNAHIYAFEIPKKGEYYWNRYSHKIECSDGTVTEKFLILEEGINLDNEGQSH